MASTSPRALAAAQRADAAIAMRTLGATLQEIADKHYSGHRSNAHRAILRAQARVTERNVDEMRAVMNDRLELIFRSNVRGVTTGDRDATTNVLRVFDRQAKLNGLDKPQQIEGVGDGLITVVFDPLVKSGGMAEVELEVDAIAE